MKEFFITATDTDAGKTFVSCALIHAITSHTKNIDQHYKVAAYKPVSAGCELINGQLINEDAKLLCDFANANQTISQINPIAFKDPIAPHIAAKKENKQITVSDIQLGYKKVKSLNTDVVIVEGAGGWRLPLGVDLAEAEKNSNTIPNGSQFLSDFVKRSQLDVILIVNMKLGCLNHALLTYEVIKADGLNCVAWVANNASAEPMNNLAENIAELESLLSVPKIAQFDFFADVDEVGEKFTFNEKIKLASSQINLEPLMAR